MNPSQSSSTTEKYKIKWYFKNKPNEINGGVSVLTEIEATEAVKALNEELPHIHHYIYSLGIEPVLHEYKGIAVRVSLDSKTVWSFQATTEGYEYIYSDSYYLKADAIKAAEEMIGTVIRS